MAEPALPILRTVDEFLAWENQQAERYEFVGGVLTLMAGGTENHDLVGSNVIGYAVPAPARHALPCSRQQSQGTVPRGCQHVPGRLRALRTSGR